MPRPKKLLTDEERKARKALYNAKAYSKAKEKRRLQYKIKKTNDVKQKCLAQMAFHRQQYEHYKSMFNVYDLMSENKESKKMKENFNEIPPIESSDDDEQVETLVDYDVEKKKNNTNDDDYIEFEYYNKIYYYDINDRNFYDIETDDKLGKVILNDSDELLDVEFDE